MSLKRQYSALDTESPPASQPASCEAVAPGTHSFRVGSDCEIIHQPPKTMYNTRRCSNNRLDSSHKYPVTIRLTGAMLGRFMKAFDDQLCRDGLGCVLDTELRRMKLNWSAAKDGTAAERRMPVKPGPVTLNASTMPVVHVELVGVGHAPLTCWVPDPSSSSPTDGEMRNLRPINAQISFEPYADEAGELLFMNLQFEISPKNLPISFTHSGQPFRFAISFLGGETVLFTDPFFVYSKESPVRFAPASERSASEDDCAHASGAAKKRVRNSRVCNNRTESVEELSRSRAEQLDRISRAAFSITAPSLIPPLRTSSAMPLSRTTTRDASEILASMSECVTKVPKE